SNLTRISERLPIAACGGGTAGNGDRGVEFFHQHRQDRRRELIGRLLQQGLNDDPGLRGEGHRDRIIGRNAAPCVAQCTVSSSRPNGIAGARGATIVASPNSSPSSSVKRRLSSLRTPTTLKRLMPISNMCRIVRSSRYRVLIRCVPR